MSSTLEDAPAPEQAQRLAGFGGLLVLGFVAGVAAAYAFVWLAAQVIGQEVGELDAAARGALEPLRSPVLDGLARAASFMGNEALYVLGAVLTVALARQRRWGALVLVALVGVGAQLLNNVLKLVFQRARPEALLELERTSTYSFPSGHAMVGMACYGFLAYLAWRLLPHVWRAPVLVVLVVLVVLIGASRVYLGVHYVTDVVAGFIAGFVWLDAVLVGAHVLKTRAPRVS